MTEPPPKRVRRGDSAAMWDQNSRATPPRAPNDRRDDRRGGYPREDRRHRSRSRSRERYEGRRTRSPERGPRRDGRDVRDGRERRERSRSRERRPPRREDGRARSRSPGRDGARDGVRRRSPPRGPRGGGPGDRTPNGVDKRPAAKAELTQPGSRTPNTSKAAITNAERMDNGVDAMDEVNGEDMEEQMRKVMGFGKFKSTKNTKVPGNDKNYGVRKEKKTQYRQYMNRVGGFNRPLSPSR